MCKVMKISRQSYYKSEKEAMQRSQKEEEIIRRVIQQRHQMPMLGGRKLLHILNAEGGSKIGRDKFFKLLGDRGLLIKKRKSYVRTTNSMHPFRKYGNLIKGEKINRSYQVYVSDITYINSTEGYSYLSLVTDLYSRKILGYSLSKSLETEGSSRVLQMATRGKEKTEVIIHHSDRGIQYCSHEYTEMLKTKGIRISMSEKGNPYENAVAERINGILKNEFMLGGIFKTRSEVELAVKEAIRNYNQKRPHMSLGYKTPELVINLSRATPS